MRTAVFILAVLAMIAMALFWRELAKPGNVKNIESRKRVGSKDQDDAA